MFNYFLEMKKMVLILTLKGILYSSDAERLKWLLDMTQAQCRNLEINLQKMLYVSPECLTIIHRWSKNARRQGFSAVVSSHGTAAAERLALEASVAEARQLEFLLECRRQKTTEKNLAD